MLTEIQKRLFELQDVKYRDFQCRLMPTVDAGCVIGVRTPLLRKLAKELYGTVASAEFMKNLPHKYYEENNLHAFLIEKIKDYAECVSSVNEFLPYVDNWATCDSMNPPVFKKHLPELLVQVREWLNCDHTYTVRFGIKCLMSYFLDEHFKQDYLEMVAAVRSEEYYIKMMVAWYFATALAKQYDAALPYLSERRLDTWTHNKTIQKATESYRISLEHKDILRQLKVQK